MIYKVFIHEGVYQELDQITTYYEERQFNLGVKFLDEWEASINQLAKGPLLFQQKYKKMRSIQLTHFPFLIIYEIEQDSIVIFKVIHAKRNLGKIFKRKI